MFMLTIPAKITQTGASRAGSASFALLHFDSDSVESLKELAMLEFLIVAAIGTLLFYLVWGPALKREEERQSEKFWMETMGWGKKKEKPKEPNKSK